MSVKTIFKALIGTIVIIVVSFLIIEVMNVSMSALQLNQITKMAAKQACVLYSQETYKIRTDGGELAGSINMPNVVDKNGVEYISGKFYDYADADLIYNKLYTSPEFKNWVQNNPAVIKGNWKSLQLIDRALNRPSTLNVTYPTYNPSMSDLYYQGLVDEYSDAMLAKLYKDVKMTPLNMGVPYLDKETLNKMFMWNVGQLLSNCKPDSIVTDDNGNLYTAFSGFRVYSDAAYISELEYKTFDLKDPTDRNYFRQLTNIDTDNIGFEFNAEYLGTADDERERVCIVGIKYTIPIAYEGITPLKRLFNYVWNTEVQGTRGSTGRIGQAWDDHLAYLESGGFDGSTGLHGVLPVPGKLIYYIIR